MPMRRYIQPSIRLRTWPLPLRWASTAAIVGIAFAARYVVFGPHGGAPFLFFQPAVIICAVLFKRGSGFLATALSALLGVYFFVEPIFSLAVANARDTVVVVGFIIIGLFISTVIDALHLAYAEAEQAQARAKAGEHERALMLAEFRHRVSNDLHRIVGMMEVQATRAGADAASALREAAGRVKVIAQMHDRLARQDGHGLVDMHDYLHDLAADLSDTLANTRPIGIFVDAEHHEVPVARAGAVGLIVNELVTNALKHAFPDENKEGTVLLQFQREAADYVLAVSDNGAGMPEDMGGSARPDGGMGTRLTRLLAAQLAGRLETASQAGTGTTSILRFPVTSPGDGYGSRQGRQARSGLVPAPAHHGD